jgi:hypothetical protein
MENIENILTLEVKNELAKRYFGFRKIIEEDTASYFKNIKKTSLQLEETVGHDLVRIYNILNQQDLLLQFFKLTGIPENLFTAAFINTAPAKDDIITQQKFRVFTRKGCLHNLFFDAYECLYKNILDYRESFAGLVLDHETIAEQIRMFYRKNDIHTILQFLRSLDNSSMNNGPPTFNPQARMSMDAKLRIEPPPPVNELLPEVEIIPTAKKIRKDLKALVTEACIQQPLLDLRDFRKR